MKLSVGNSAVIGIATAAEGAALIMYASYSRVLISTHYFNLTTDEYGLVFLPEADHGVEDQQDQDDGQVHPMADQRRKDGGHLDHPGDWPPEIAEEFEQGAFPFLGQRIWAVLLKASQGFRMYTEGASTAWLKQIL